MLTFSPHTDRQRLGQGKFQLQRIRPGLRLNNPADAGLGPLGLVDHSFVQPGLEVPMHEHRNDEILSYARRGQVIHEDSTGVRQTVTPAHLMLMGAGRGFRHEEYVPADGEPLELLQIFIRPHAAELAPQVLFHRFDAADSPNAWRLVGGPTGTGAPLSIRSAVWLYDAHLTRHTLALPALGGHTAFLYVVRGNVTIPGPGLAMQLGDSLIISGEAIRVTAPDEAEVIVFLLDMQAPFSRAGTLSG